MVQPNSATSISAIDSDLFMAGPGTLDGFGELMFLEQADEIRIGGINRTRLTAIYSDKEQNVDHEIQMILPLVEADPTTPFVTIPGCTETPRAGTGKMMTYGLAAKFPGSPVASIGSDGLNRYGSTFTARELLGRTFADMGAARARGIAMLTGGEPVVIVPESMGGPITQHALAYNTCHEIVDVEAVVHHSDAINTPDQAWKRMMGPFPASMYVDVVRQSVKHPVQAAASFDFRPDLLRPRSWAAIAGQVIHLVQGTDMELIEENAHAYREGFVVGRSDPLYQRQLLDTLQAEFPDTVYVKEVDGGHAAALCYKDTARDISEVLDKLQALQKPRAAH